MNHGRNIEQIDAGQLRKRGPLRRLEKDVQAEILYYLALQRIFAIRVNSGAMVGEHKGKKRFVRFTNRDGVSDILAVMPPSGRMLAIEVKRDEKEKAKPAQQIFLEDIRRAGGIAIVAYCVEDVERALMGLT